jgi:DNA-binding CsgD family transcriptional regulator/PAS domain-containing protein
MTADPALIGSIYDAAAEPALWHEVIARLVRMTGARNGIFYDHDTATRQASILGADGFDPHFVRAYEQYYAALDPWHRRGLARPVGDIAQTASMLADAELRRTEFYQDHLRPQNLFYAMGGPVARSGTRMAVFGVQSSYEDGVFAPEAEALARSVVRHFRRAYRLQQALDSVRRESLEFEAALRCLPQPVLVVEPDARIVFANAAGAQMLRDRDVLTASAGRLRAAHRGDAAALSKALRPVPQAADGDASLVLRRAGSAQPVVVRAVPLRSGNRAEWSGRIALLVEVPAPPLPLEAMAAAFRLSPAEARLWAALADGKRLADIAAEHGVSVNTARVQLRSLFQKTGVHRQADLLRLALEAALPRR